MWRDVLKRNTIHITEEEGDVLEICNRDFIEALHQLIDIYSWSSHV